MATLEHYIIHYTVHPEISKGKLVCSPGLRYLSLNGMVVANYVMLNKKSSSRPAGRIALLN